MDSKLKNFKDSLTLQECEKTSLTTPFSINDILTKENEGKYCHESFGAKSFLAKASSCYAKEDFPKKEVLEKSLKYYDECGGYRDYADDGALDMSRKNSYAVTELSGKFPKHFLTFSKIFRVSKYGEARDFSLKMQ